MTVKYYLLGGPNTTANLCCICSSERETCHHTDAVQICGSILNAINHSNLYISNVDSKSLVKFYCDIPTRE